MNKYTYYFEYWSEGIGKWCFESGVINEEPKGRALSILIKHSIEFPYVRNIKFEKEPILKFLKLQDK
jgi:hypothetical protein